MQPELGDGRVVELVDLLAHPQLALPPFVGAAHGGHARHVKGQGAVLALRVAAAEGVHGHAVVHHVLPAHQVLRTQPTGVYRLYGQPPHDITLLFKVNVRFTSTESIRTIRDGGSLGRPPRLSHSTQDLKRCWLVEEPKREHANQQLSSRHPD